MKTVNVLHRIYRVQHLGLVHVLGQGQLHQYPVHRRVVVELLDQSQNLLFRSIRRQFGRLLDNPQPLARLAFVPNINMRCRVITNKYDLIQIVAIRLASNGSEIQYLIIILQVNRG
jgi:hypothetical protein